MASSTQYDRVHSCAIAGSAAIVSFSVKVNIPLSQRPQKLINFGL